MALTIQRLSIDDLDWLCEHGDPLFDHPVIPASAARFLAHPDHHLVVARDGILAVGFVSATETLHPDKEHPELFINEVGVVDSHRRQGIARALLAAMAEVGRQAGCVEGWVLTEHDNAPALELYRTQPATRRDDDAAMFTLDLQQH